MKETVDEIRTTLLRDERVVHAIQHRAYEIWVLRGRQEGRAEEDWRLAENEVVGFLIEQELRNAVDQPAFADDVVEVADVVVIATPFATEDIAPEPIPEADLIIVAEVTTPAEGKAKKPRTRSTTKSTTQSKRLGKTATEGDRKATPAKKTVPAKKATTKKAASKKSTKPDQPLAE